MRKISKIPEFEATGIGFSRAVPPIQKCDLTDRAAVVLLMNQVKPDIVIHCAAERDPDRVRGLLLFPGLFCWSLGLLLLFDSSSV